MTISLKTRVKWLTEEKWLCRLQLNTKYRYLKQREHMERGLTLTSDPRPVHDSKSQFIRTNLFHAPQSLRSQRPLS
jgi:hypothetical protein